MRVATPSDRRAQAMGAAVIAGTANGYNPTRPNVRGKFVFLDDRKLYLRGVTYGTFRPGADGTGYPDDARVDSDFLEMALNGVNSVRTYSPPPPRVLDAASRYGLRVLIGLPWEQHVAFLEDRARARSIEARVRDGVHACAGHPAVLGYAVGNEIPAPIVRWHGRRRVERFLRRLYEAAKEEDPEGLVTYVNYPTTEYLELPFLDFHCFNVFLEERERLAAYLARLQNLAGEKPLVMSEIGFDSARHGKEAQGAVLDWQVRTVFESGCAGAFVFAWTDEWHRGGHEVEDWDFGLTDRQRRPKPALAAVRGALRDAPFGVRRDWPRVSVIVCTHNGARTLHDCLEGIERLDYPDYEAIVVNDGSSDESGSIAAEHAVRLINTPNRGLARARNTGLAAASGEIVAYLDDDARPDPDWLTYLVRAFATSEHVGIGGPNIAPDCDGLVADCVASSPGGPVHVLLSDELAEHIPGCNMAFRRDALEAIGGFDPQFRAAGDDVDVCWRLQERGGTLGFSPAAMVWHRPRTSVRAYWKQQRGYGKAEAMLELKWPEKYNRAGHFSWHGRLYGRGLAHAFSPHRWRVYYGTWGSALFQRVYEGAPPTLATIALMPEWYLLLVALTALSALSLVWAPMLLAVPLLAGAAIFPAVQAVGGARRTLAHRSPGRVTGGAGWLPYPLTTLLHLTQPLMRLSGRIGTGLTPWRWRGGPGNALSGPRSWELWSETGRPLEGWIAEAEQAIKAEGGLVRRGGDYDRWDLEVRGGILGGVRTLATAEEHGGGRQLVRFRSWLRPRAGALALTAILFAVAVAATTSGAFVPGAALAVLAAVIGGRTALECLVPAGVVGTALDTAWRSEGREESLPGPAWRVPEPGGEEA